MADLTVMVLKKKRRKIIEKGWKYVEIQALGRSDHEESEMQKSG